VRKVLHEWTEHSAFPNTYRIVRGEWQGIGQAPEKVNEGDAWLEVVDACDQWLSVGIVDYAVANELERLSDNHS
jgi:hypothetical protein